MHESKVLLSRRNESETRTYCAGRRRRGIPSVFPPDPRNFSSHTAHLLQQKHDRVSNEKPPQKSLDGNCNNKKYLKTY